MKNAVFHFRVGHIGEANALVVAHHYSRRPPANVQFVGTWHTEGGLFGDYGAAVAACFLCIPPTRWSEPLLELSRLVRSPVCSVPLTGLIAQTMAFAKKGGVDLVVSFADRTQRHHGGIYQAASWNYDGCRDRRMDGLLIDKKFHAGRSCNSAWGTRSPDRLRAILPGRQIEPHFDEGKHLYWRSLTRDGERKAHRLGLKRCAYPKPNEKAIA